MATRYANADTGNDTTGTGTSGAPYATLDKAITVSSDNDTVILQQATTDYVFQNDTIPAGLTIQGDVVPNMITQEWVRVTVNGAARQWNLSGNLTMENVVLYNFVGSANYSLIYWGSLSGVSQIIQFTNCVFDTMSTLCSTSGRGGVIGNGGALGVPAQNSITLNFDRCLITNIKRNGGSAPYSGFIHTNGTQFTIRFRETTFYNPSTGTALDKIVSSYAGSVPYFRNCIFNTDEAVPPTFCESYWGASDSSIVEYCNYYGMNTTGATITNSVNSDPLFLDKANKDFRLKPASPSIDTGVLV